MLHGVHARYATALMPDMLSAVPDDSADLLAPYERKAASVEGTAFLLMVKKFPVCRDSSVFL